MVYCSNEPDRLFQKDSFKEILGRKILIGDVMKAIDPFGNYGWIAGHISRVNRKEQTYKFLCKWEDKNLDWHRDNRKDVIKFLADLLR